MTAADVTVGYPAHALAEFRPWTNRHGARFVDWRASCGASGTSTGTRETAFGVAATARRRELCPFCWPGGHATQHPRPVELPS